MGFLLKPRAATYNDTEGWFYDWVTGADESGTSVTPSNAMRISTVWKCVRARAETFGMVPKKLWERVDILGRPSQREADKHALFDLIHASPNPTLTSMAWFELISADLDLWGNSYAYIERLPGSAAIRWLWRIRPDLIRIEYNDDQLWYIVRDADGHEAKFFPDEILHIRGLGFDGICGYSPIQMQKRALTWNSATVVQSSNFYENASRPSFIASTQNAIKGKDAKDALIKSLTRSGKDAGKGILVEGPIDIKMLQFSPDDMKFVETAQLQEEDICGIFRVPPHKVGILRRSTNNNIEHQAIEWITDSIQPICERVEQWMDLGLLSGRRSTGYGGATERERYFVECDLKGLLRGDTAAQTAHIQTMIDKGVYCQNDGRHYLGLPPVEGGDTYWMNLAYGPIDQIRELLAAESESDPADLTVRDKLRAELQARVQVSYSKVFRPAVGKALKRSVKDRERAVPGLFDGILEAIAHGLGVQLNESFVTDYLGAMAQRSLEWNDVDEVTGAELDRAVKAIQERGQA